MHAARKGNYAVEAAGQEALAGRMGIGEIKTLTVANP